MQKYNSHSLPPFTVQLFDFMNYHGSVNDFLQFKTILSITTEETKIFVLKIQTREAFNYSTFETMQILPHFL